MIRQLKLTFFRERRERQREIGRQGDREIGKLNLKNSAFAAIGVTLAICILNYRTADRNFVNF
ncbi:hypothetical protein C7B69_16655 [filamentous cyanobacterium Phorm 46]|nr:hypothetical protein C7B69_16655 [filamentous cyanobacterium Phorm 46]